jgi:hypothetical protein
LREGVLRVLQEDFRKRAAEVKGEIEEFDIIAIIARAIDEVAAL